MYGNENRDAQPVYLIDNPNHTANGPGAAGAIGIVLLLIYKIVFWAIYLWWAPEFEAIENSKNVYKVAVVESVRRGFVASPEDEDRFHIFDNYEDLNTWMVQKKYVIKPYDDFYCTHQSDTSANKEYEYNISLMYVIYKNKDAWMRRQFMAASVVYGKATVNVADKIMPRDFFLWLLHANKDDAEEFRKIYQKKYLGTSKWGDDVKKQSSWIWFIYSYLNLYRWWNEWLA
jgi:hypothetical protein